MTTATMNYETYQLPKSSYTIHDVTFADRIQRIFTLKLAAFQIIIFALIVVVGKLRIGLPSSSILFHIPLTVDCYNIQLKYYSWELLLDIVGKLLNAGVCT